MMSKPISVALAFAMAFLFVGAVHAQLVFDFEDGSLGDWTPIDEDPALLGDAGPSTWEVRASELGLDGNVVYQGSNIWGTATDESLMGTILLYMGEQFVDFKLEIDVAAADNDGMGIVWGYQDANNYYRAIMINDRWPDPPADGFSGPFLKMQKRFSDQSPWHELLAIVKDTYVPYPEDGSRLHWTLEVQNGNFTFTREDGLSISASDPAYSGGYVGIQLYAQQAEFDNIVITPLGVTAVDPAGKTSTTWGALKATR